MAFSFKDQSDNGGGWMTTVGIVIAILLLGFGAYLLFWAPEPFVEVLVPEELESISDLSDAYISEDTFMEDEVYKSLEAKVGDIIIEEAGRENPFAPF